MSSSKRGIRILQRQASSNSPDTPSVPQKRKAKPLDLELKYGTRTTQATTVPRAVIPPKEGPPPPKKGRVVPEHSEDGFGNHFLDEDNSPRDDGMVYVELPPSTAKVIIFQYLLYHN